MRVLILVLLFSVQGFAMSHLQAFNVLHQVASKVPMVAADHAKVEHALEMMRKLAEDKHAEISKEQEARKKEKMCSEEKKDG